MSRSPPELSTSSIVCLEESLRIDGPAFEELKHDPRILQLATPNLLLSLQHGKVRQQVHAKSMQVLLAHGPFVEILTQVLYRKGQCHSDENKDVIGQVVTQGVSCKVLESG